jgi:spermidine/putrescine transport system substrate-binding protein
MRFSKQQAAASITSRRPQNDREREVVMIDVARLREGLRAGRIGRREFMRLLAVAGVAVGATGGRRTVQAAETPTVFTWAGYDDPNFYPTYVKKYGGPPDFAMYADEEEGLQKILAGFEPDVVLPCAYKVARWYEAGVLGEIDTSKIRAFGDIFESLRDIPAGVQDGKRVWLPADWGQTSIVYRTDLAPEYVGNESWSILWDPKYEGRVAMFDSLTDGVVVAGIMAGLADPFDYSTDESLAKVRAKLEELVPQLRYFVPDSTTLEQGLASGEIVAATGWNESIGRLREQGLAVRFMEPKEGAMTWVCGVGIVKGTKLPDQAHEIVDALLDPEARAYEMRNFGYGSATKTPYTMLSQDELAALGLSPNPEAVLSKGILQSPIKGEERLQRMFEEVKASRS